MNKFPGAASNVIPVEFDQGARYQNFMSELEQLPEAEQGFFGTHLEMDLRTGGIKRDEAGNPVKYREPSGNPFDLSSEHISR